MKIKHCILVKWLDKSIQTEDFLKGIEEVFASALEIEGIERVEHIRNVIDRANRYDYLIAITMDSNALPVYDDSLSHKKWKQSYGDLIEKKAIFDFAVEEVL